MSPTLNNNRHGWRLDHHHSNGYDTDSSQDSRHRNGANSRSRPNPPWRPMRDALNVDSVLSSTDVGSPVRDEQRHHSPRRRTSSQSPTRERDQDFTWGGRDERKPKSLMTIYEDEQKQETRGSRSSLISVGKDRSKDSATLKVHNDNWKIQRTESGYESSDRLSNGSANLDSPVVEGLSSKDLRSVPELQPMR